MRKVCIFTSTRAEWGLLLRVAEQVQESASLQLQILASGSHLSPQSGMTINEIEASGFEVDETIDILRFDDSPVGICKVMGLALSTFGEALTRLSPDILVVLGDRYESFCVAAAAQILLIPIAHIHGGETTEGAVDEAFRHSITKMSHLHFASCETYRRRIIQLGETPARVFNVGALGIENIQRIEYLSLSELETSVGFRLDAPFFLVTFHPVTLEDSTAEAQIEALLSVLDKFVKYKTIFTQANADTDSNIINQKIDAYSAAHSERCLSTASLGLLRYLSAMKHCEAVIGNSSSGIIEAPALHVPTVNIGDRQKGRIRLESIIDCEPTPESIEDAIYKALNVRFKSTVRDTLNSSDNNLTSRRISKEIADTDLDNIVKKSFFDL